jgi:cysteinyl-tRNA synthetase
MHGYFLTLASAKMSKSTGDFLRLKLLTDRGYDPLAYRYLCLTAHYRSQMSFTWEAMDAAHAGLDRLRRNVHELGEAGAPDESCLARFHDTLNDDLQFPKAMALVSETLRSGLADAVKKATLLAYDACLGLKLGEWQPKVEPIPAEVEALAKQRWAARQAKNWSESDRLRDAIAAHGYAVEDGAGSYRLLRKTG